MQYPRCADTAAPVATHRWGSTLHGRGRPESEEKGTQNRQGKYGDGGRAGGFPFLAHVCGAAGGKRR